MKKNIAILGSTGSIGRQSLEVIARNPERFEVEVLTANNNTELLIEQAIQFQPNVVVIGNVDKLQEVRISLKDFPVKVYAGSEAIEQVVQMENIDLVLTAMVGYSGVIPTIKAIEAGRNIALANKETLVVAGDIITNLAVKNNVAILPVDSEHSAIFQCLTGEQMNPIEKIMLTCSGGPFRGKSREELLHVKPADALNHPNWDMGAKITIDSATLMNKGFEMIEAHWLFGRSPDDIEVVIHPQSIIHSMVQFRDGSIKAQLGLPDMRLPIQYALSFPERFENDFPRFSFMDYPMLTFEKPDMDNFRNLALAFEAIRLGGNMPCVLNAANEVVVCAFLMQKIGFTEMSDIIEETMGKAEFIAQPTLDDYIATNSATRDAAQLLVDTR